MTTRTAFLKITGRSLHEMAITIFQTFWLGWLPCTWCNWTLKLWHPSSGPVQGTAMRSLPAGGADCASQGHPSSGMAYWFGPGALHVFLWSVEVVFCSSRQKTTADNSNPTSPVSDLVAGCYCLIWPVCIPRDLVLLFITIVVTIQPTHGPQLATSTGWYVLVTYVSLPRWGIEVMAQKVPMENWGFEGWKIKKQHQTTIKIGLIELTDGWLIVHWWLTDGWLMVDWWLTDVKCLNNTQWDCRVEMVESCCVTHGWHPMA